LACAHCLEYSFKRITVEAASAAQQKELKTRWVARRTCGICGLEQELGIDAHGELVYGG
jgi:hypothetical protein